MPFATLSIRELRGELRQKLTPTADEQSPALRLGDIAPNASREDTSASPASEVRVKKTARRSVLLRNGFLSASRTTGRFTAAEVMIARHRGFTETFSQLATGASIGKPIVRQSPELTLYAVWTCSPLRRT